MDWDKLKIFHNVALDLNISEAANKMNISHSSISRQISSLEKDLKVSLFNRHARGLSLTEQGSILFKTVHDVVGKIALTKAELTDSKDKPEMFGKMQAILRPSDTKRIVNDLKMLGQAAIQVVYKKGKMIDKKKFNKFLRKERQMTNSKIMARYAQFKLYLHNKKK